jgi:hypothetical protein
MNGTRVCSRMAMWISSSPNREDPLVSHPRASRRESEIKNQDAGVSIRQPLRVSDGGTGGRATRARIGIIIGATYPELGQIGDARVSVGSLIWHC